MDMEKVKELRENFLEQLSSKGTDAVHPKDLERVKKDDHWLHRFLKHHDSNLNPALDMLWEVVTWRKEFKTNEVADLVKMDIIVQGGFFPHGHDKDGCTLFVFKCKKYVKGTHQMDDLKRCVIYWFERLERQDKGKPITIFFDMDGCGLANMDLEFVKYLIGLFKQYYPFFLNYIVIFEMPWILNGISAHFAAHCAVLCGSIVSFQWVFKNIMTNYYKVVVIKQQRYLPRCSQVFRDFALSHRLPLFNGNLFEHSY